MLLKTLFKKNVTAFLFFPILLNSSLNILNFEFEKFYSREILIRFCSFLLTSIFFIVLSYCIKKILKINSNSLSITFFLTTYFIFDLCLLFFNRNISSRSSFYIVSTVWILFLFFRIDKKDFLYLLSTFLFMRTFNRFNLISISDKSLYSDLNTDVEVQWLPIAKMLYENNYFYAIQNNLIDGQSLFLSYIQTVIMRVNFDTFNFDFIQINANIVIIISSLLIFDLDISFKNKLISSTTLLLLLLNSDWLFYLLANSLMLEGLLNIFVATYFFNIKYFLNMNSKKSKMFFLTFGTLALTKQFVATLSLVLFIFLIVFIRNRQSIIFSVIPFTLNLIFKYLYFESANLVTYTNDLDYKDLILDFLYLRDLEFGNISKIVINFWMVCFWPFVA